MRARPPAPDAPLRRTSGCWETSSVWRSSNRKAKDLLADEERIRGLSRKARGGGPGRPGPRTDLASAVPRASPRAPGRRGPRLPFYFMLANLAEQYHRHRRRRQYEQEERSRAKRSTRRSPARGRRHRDADSRGRRRPRSSASSRPTRPRRRAGPATAQLRLAAAPRARQPALRQPGARRIGDAIAEEMTALWQTDEVRSLRPRSSTRSGTGSGSSSRA